MKFKSLNLKNLILVAIFALMSGSAWAYSFMVDGIYYNITDANNLIVEVTNNGSYCTYNTSVVIPATVTNDNQTYTVTAIGNSAFRGCTSLTSVNGTGAVNVTIPTSVTSIKDNAFLGCSGLTDLTLPANLTSVGQSAFQGCSGLENIYFYAANCEFNLFNVWLGCTHACTVTIGNGVAGVPNNAFRELTGLNAIVWGEHTTFTIGENAFYNCTGLMNTLTIPNFVTSIGGSAFNGCTGITTLTIGTDVSNIGSRAFNGCSSLANIYFNATNCTVGGSGIFENCTNDCTATIGDNVTNLPNYLFYQHSGLKTINWGTHTTLTIGEYSFSRCGLTTVVIPDCVTSIAHNAFTDCGNLTTLTIGASVTSVGYYAFSGCSKLETVNYHAINCTYIPDNGSIYSNMWNGCNKLTTIVIGNEVTHLPAKLFYETRITTVNFDTDPHLQVINNRAFYNCDYLTSFTIPNTVTTIGYDAFRDDNALQTITIGFSVTTIGDHILYGCSGLETINWNVTNAENNLSLGSNCFTGIGNADQHNCALTVGDNVIALPNSIFSGCSGITSLTLGSRLQTIGDYAFSGCSHIGAITIPNSVTYLGKESFKNCSAATSLSIGAGVQDIKQGAFAYCSGLTSLTIPTTVTTIGDTDVTAGAFQGCTGLTELIIPDNVTFVGRDAFNGCSNITTITIGDGVTYIGLTAFASCTSLSELTIGEGITTIDVNAFQNNGNLAAVYYNATSCSDLGTTDKLWTNCNHDCTVHIGNNVTKLPQSIFSNFSHLTTVDFGSTTQLTTIGSHAFESCTGLTTVVIPNSVTTIDSDAFEGCTGMTSLNLGTGVQTIGVRAFKGCTGLTTLMIPASVTNIEGVTWSETGAFYGCTGLTEIWFMGTTQPSINSFAFDGVSETIPLYYPKGYLSSYTYGRFANKIPFSRFDGGSGETGAQWGVASNWAFGIPQYNEAALINATAIIPGAYTVNVDHIAFTGSNYMIIENAGQLSCNSIASHDVNTVTIRNGGQLICNTAVQGTVQKTIAAYTSNNDGWNFIASPVTETLVTTEINGMLPTNGTTVYDLYYLDEAADMWRNFKPENEHSGFNIEHNKGYLYANSAGTTISFAGTIQNNVEEGVSIDLAKAGNGWNLVGNPFAFNAYANKPYYVINGRYVEAYTGTDPIAPCTGIIVKATGTEETVTFRRTAFAESVNNGNIQMSLLQSNTRDAKAIDNAIVSFNEGEGMPKFNLMDQEARLYIPQDGKEYAIVHGEKQGVMPLNFEAKANGNYTITVDAENTEMTYLHLIDNLTGADIDLLATPSYSFDAKTTDYASRFRLVFDANGSSTGSETEDETFAYYDGSEWVIANTDEAILQVVDMTGRVLSTETISGNATININQPAGVYVMRLMNGEHVKVQKVVVR